MKKIYALIAVAALFGGTRVKAQQDWTEMMKDHNANVHDVQKAFNDWYQKQDDPKTSSSRLITPDTGDDDDADGNFMLFKRWEWIMAARTYPSGNRPDMVEIAKEYKDFMARNAADRASNINKIEATAKWTYAGTSNIPTNGGAGRLNRIRVNPSNSNILYACSPSGGLWISTNGGSSWSTKTDQLPSIGTSDIAIDPTNTSIMYLATGDGDGIAGGFTTPSTVGVLKSTDGGNTWNPTGLAYTLSVSGPSMSTVNELAISPTNHNTIFAACSFGLYFSFNGGLTWSEAKAGDFKSIAFKPGDSSVFYASTSTGQFYRSNNGGMTYTLVALPGSSGIGRVSIAVTAANPDYVYVLGDNNSTGAFLGLWLSKDAGQTFTEQSTSPNLLGFSPTGSDLSGQGWYTLSLAASPTNASEIIVGGVNIWRSTNAGVTWKLNADQTGSGAPYVHADIHDLEYLNGTTYFAACDGGLFKTTNSGTNWSDLSNGLEIAEQYSIGLSASVSTEWLTGWQDNGTNLANVSWKEVLGGDGMVCFIDNTNNNYMYGETYQGSFNMSSNGGGTWKNIAIATGESADWVTPWLQDPMASQTLFGGYENVWKSTNRGTSWAKISTWGVSGNYIVALAVAPTNDSYIYAATYSTLEATTNGGSTWTNVTAGLPVGTVSISGITVCSTNPARLWVTLSGYYNNNKVYESDNGGASWKDISTGLPNLPANCIAYQGGGIDAMYVGTDAGVYYRDTTNTAGVWVSYNSGLPDVPVADLKIYSPTSMLRAATYGRGTWQIATYSPSGVTPVARFKAYPTTICANSSVQFTDTSSNEPTSWNWTFTGGTPSTSTLQNPVVTYSTAGTYQVTLKATNGTGSNTLSKTSYITVNPMPSTPLITQSGSLLSCTPNNLPYYQWYLNNNIIPYDTVSQFWMTSTGVYKVTIWNSYGCSLTSSPKVVTVLGVDEVSQSDNIKIYPNPTNGEVNLSFNIQQEGNYTLTLANVLGQVVYKDDIHLNGPETKAINMANFGNGIYMLSINGNNVKIVKKIVVY